VCGSSKANAASISTTKTSCDEFSSASSRITRRIGEQEVGDEGNQRRPPHEDPIVMLRLPPYLISCSRAPVS
jgi:hypothetical protein